jgi:hypothetical protein
MDGAWSSSPTTCSASRSDRHPGTALDVPDLATDQKAGGSSPSERATIASMPFAACLPGRSMPRIGPASAPRILAVDRKRQGTLDAKLSVTRVRLPIRRPGRVPGPGSLHRSGARTVSRSTASFSPAANSSTMSSPSYRTRLNRRSTTYCTRRRTGANRAAAASVAAATATGV